MDKKEDNSIHIGNGNKIKNSVIGQNIKVEQEHTKERSINTKDKSGPLSGAVRFDGYNRHIDFLYETHILIPA